MENIIVIEKADGNYLLKAAEGYRLYNINTQTFYSEAVVKEADFGMWKAVEA